MSSQKEYFKVPAEIMQAALDYMSQRPWREVNPLIQGLGACGKIDPIKKEKTMNDLLTCYLTGQMNDAQWASHCEKNPKLLDALAVHIADKKK